MSPECHCGHERSEHYRTAEGPLVTYDNCMRQCDCKRFISKDAPKPVPPRPAHAFWCQCYRCKQYPTQPPADEDEAPSTDRMPWP